MGVAARCQRSGSAPAALARVMAVSVGQPQARRLPPAFPEAERVGRYWTAIGKTPCPRAVAITVDGLRGDAQADREHHGGPDKAVHAHFAQHLLWWGARRGRPLAPGEIGENLLLGAPAHGPEPDEALLCIGDVLRAGTALLQVTQPRIPCHKQAGALGLADAVRLVAASARCGLYLRVLRSGHLQVGDVLILEERPNPGVTVADAHRFVHGGRHDAGLRARLAAASGLGPDIRRRLEG